MAKPMLTCSTCQFYLVYGSKGATTGQCRRFPPQVNLLNDDGGTTADFPDVSEMAWCGEHSEFNRQVSR
jgi:hypothetical protein